MTDVYLGIIAGISVQKYERCQVVIVDTGTRKFCCGSPLLLESWHCILQRHDRGDLHPCRQLTHLEVS